MSASSPPPVIYEDRYYQQISELEGSHWWHRGMRAVALALLRSSHHAAPKCVLDAGCGTGGMMAWAKQTLGSETVWGFDVAFGAVERAWSKPGYAGSVLNASVTEIPFAEDKFDLVICYDVLQHLHTSGGDTKALSEIARVLTPGGALLLRTNSRRGMFQKKHHQDEDYQRYNLTEVEQIVSGAGLQVQRATYANLIGGAHESLRRVIGLRRPTAESRSNSGRERRLYEGLSMRNTAKDHPLTNQILTLCMRCEAILLEKTAMRVGFGHSIFVLATKPN